MTQTKRILAFVLVLVLSKDLGSALIFFLTQYQSNCQ